eukprot:7396927-Karenia_brevis.AAC.1
MLDRAWCKGSGRWRDCMVLDIPIRLNAYAVANTGPWCTDTPSVADSGAASRYQACCALQPLPLTYPPCDASWKVHCGLVCALIGGRRLREAKCGCVEMGTSKASVLTWMDRHMKLNGKMHVSLAGLWWSLILTRGSR